MCVFLPSAGSARLCLCLYSLPCSGFVSSQTRSVFRLRRRRGREVSRNRVFGNMTHCLFTQNLVDGLRGDEAAGGDPGDGLTMQKELHLKPSCQKQHVLSAKSARVPVKCHLLTFLSRFDFLGRVTGFFLGCQWVCLLIYQQTGSSGGFHSSR